MYETVLYSAGKYHQVKGPRPNGICLKKSRYENIAAVRERIRDVAQHPC